jgi:hypothetical protein
LARAHACTHSHTRTHTQEDPLTHTHTLTHAGGPIAEIPFMAAGCWHYIAPVRLRCFRAPAFLRCSVGWEGIGERAGVGGTGREGERRGVFVNLGNSVFAIYHRARRWILVVCGSTANWCEQDYWPLAPLGLGPGGGGEGAAPWAGLSALTGALAVFARTRC